MFFRKHLLFSLLPAGHFYWWQNCRCYSEKKVLSFINTSSTYRHYVNAVSCSQLKTGVELLLLKFRIIIPILWWFYFVSIFYLQRVSTLFTPSVVYGIYWIKNDFRFSKTYHWGIFKHWSLINDKFIIILNPLLPCIR